MGVPKVINVDTALQALLKDSRPRIYGKIGTTELQALEFGDRHLTFPWPTALSWKRSAKRLFVDSGVFPQDRDQFERFLVLYRKCITQLDGICIWQDMPYWAAYEKKIAARLCMQARVLEPSSLSPFCILPKICHLRWVVVSPFARSMQKQATRLRQIFGRMHWARELPESGPACEFVRCPLFSYMETSPYRNWSEGLERLSEEVLAKDFDLAIVGAGAWSLPLLERVKRAGKKGIHLGGNTQLLFGIKGRRWDEYCAQYYNEFWIRPSEEETPVGYLQKEQGCYW